MNELPEVLYHGTRSGLLPRIALGGLAPRILTQQSNWGHTIESREDAVYLTQAYALHYAQTCQAPGDPVILEIDTALLDEDALAADEDGVAQLADGRAQAGPAATLEDATIYWRDRIHEVTAQTSLRSIGNCTYFGVVPAKAIRRVLRLSQKDATRLTLQACDPVVSVRNYQFFGEDYRAFSKWLFDPQGPCPGTRLAVEPPATQPVPLQSFAGQGQ